MIVVLQKHDLERLARRCGLFAVQLAVLRERLPADVDFQFPDGATVDGGDLRRIGAAIGDFAYRFHKRGQRMTEGDTWASIFSLGDTPDELVQKFESFVSEAEQALDHRGL